MGRVRGSPHTITKRRRQLSHQLVSSMLGGNALTAKSRSTVGLMNQLIKRLDEHLESDDVELQHKAMDKLIKLMPFVIPKEGGPAVQLNVQNNSLGPQVSSGKSTTIAVSTITDYLKKRDARIAERNKMPIEDAEIVSDVDEDNSDEDEYG